MEIKSNNPYEVLSLESKEAREYIEDGHASLKSLRGQYKYKDKENNQKVYLLLRLISKMCSDVSNEFKIAYENDSKCLCDSDMRDFIMEILSAFEKINSLRVEET